MTWAAIKKQMTRFDFKNWLTNLRMGVDHIPHPAIKRVERIIMMDPSITYERMREVSTAGYKLLIVVAACLQYGSIAEELRGLRKTVSIVERRRGRLLAFVEGVAEIGAAQVGEEDAADTELTLLENDVAPAAE
ncbi:hypothetical protein DFJ73DRAFT_861050 [Zopfochytrium polystomum]|nr:hypothetical protein DFJ73DRAFT_861050 [Zopfochytrium polystomum]